MARLISEPIYNVDTDIIFWENENLHAKTSVMLYVGSK